MLVEDLTVVDVKAMPGIGVYNSENVTVRNCKLERNAYGVYVKDSKNVEIISNKIMDNSIGVYLHFSTNIQVIGNEVQSSSLDITGIDLYASPSNLITGNIVEGFMYRIRLAGTRDYKSTGNTIHGNDFNNMNNTYEITAANTWDNGLRGNYWSDYRGIDGDGDGVGDTPYVINSENVDRYPLVKPVHKVEYTVAVKSAYGAVEGSGVYARGSNVTISLDRSIVDYGNGTRRVFKGWFQDGELVSRERGFTLIIDKPVEILAEWDTEYEVKVSSERGVVTGSGWYKAGDTAEYH
ncbi:MAG: NosD domain-containing protein [Thermofilaceae archaeon]